ncbi:MAG: hypothetical protein PW788_03055 [Micavibrio sp.]|nr:hypothetical protein [Micavibrio sp.]
MINDNEPPTFSPEMNFTDAVEQLCRQITAWHNDTPDLSMAIVVDIATTDELAQEMGWPSSEMMVDALNEALATLPIEISRRVEVDEVS